jgi:hypothetical protein
MRLYPAAKSRFSAPVSRNSVYLFLTDWPFAMLARPSYLAPLAKPRMVDLLTIFRLPIAVSFVLQRIRAEAA